MGGVFGVFFLDDFNFLAMFFNCRLFVGSLVLMS